VVLNSSPDPRNRDEARKIITEHFNKTLKAATEEHKGEYRWLFVQTHKPVTGLADHATDKDIQYYVETGFEQLMDMYLVDFVLTGHDHIYTRSHPIYSGKRVDGKADGSITGAGGTVYFTLNSSTGQKFYQEFVLGVKNNTDYPYFEDGTKGSTVLMSGKVPYAVNVYHRGAGQFYDKSC
jgi:hypothetical protein